MYGFWTQENRFDITLQFSMIEMGVFFGQYIYFFMKLCAGVIKKVNKPNRSLSYSEDKDICFDVTMRRKSGRSDN